MAKIDGSDPSVLMNPNAYSGVREEKKTGAGRSVRRSGEVSFSSFFNEFLGKTADELGAFPALPVSDDSINLLMDEVHNAGDHLLKKPLPEEIMRYKQAVRNFINYVAKNCFSMENDEGIQNKYKPAFKGRRGTPEGEKQFGYTKIQVIDKKLEDLAATLLMNQKSQLGIVARLEEIKGLLIDLLH